MDYYPKKRYGKFKRNFVFKIALIPFVYLIYIWNRLPEKGSNALEWRWRN